MEQDYKVSTHLEFRSMLSLNNFLKPLFIENVGVSAEIQYYLQYISVNVSDENKHQILDSLGRKKSHFMIEHIQNLILLIRKPKGNIILKI